MNWQTQIHSRITRYLINLPLHYRKKDADVTLQKESFI